MKLYFFNTLILTASRGCVISGITKLPLTFFPFITLKHILIIKGFAYKTRDFIDVYFAFNNNVIS